MGLFDIFGSGDQQNAANSQIAGINQGYGQLSDQFGLGRQAATSNFTSALQPFQQNFNQAQQGTQQYGNALGLNGAAGNQQALQGFQNNPGYQFQLQQGLGAVQAEQQRMGQGQSGNQMLALQNYGQGLANQSWQQYLQNLQPYLGAQQSAAQGIGAVNTGLGSALMGSYTNQGNAAYGAAASKGNAQATADMAPYQASGNFWGTLLGAGNIAAQAFGGKKT